MGASLLVLANKQDSASALSIDKIKASLGLANLDGKHHHWAVFGTSAVSGFNIPQSLNWLVSELNAVRFGRSSIES
jgi:signal recognition particle receptor subunit beta